MTNLICIVGLVIVVAGVLLAWHGKGNGTWATFSFGFLLVLVGGPLGSQLQTLSVSGTGLDVSFTPRELDEAEVSKIEAVAGQAFVDLTSSAPLTGENSIAHQFGTAAASFQEELFRLITSLGFAPTQLVGVSRLAPGSIVRIVEGKPILWATPQEAFPSLEATSSAIAIPGFDQIAPGADPQQQVSVSFACRGGATLQEVSYSSLSSKLNRSLLPKLKQNPELKVVQAAISCSGLQLKALSEAVGGNPDAERVEYESEEPVVLGYRLAQLSVGGS